MPETTDPTFYRTPGEAIAAPPEQLAYVAAYDPAGQTKDAMTVIDTDPSSPDYGQVVGWSELPTAGNELHHFGWNACSSALCHQGHNGHGQPLERRYLIVPGLRSSRTYVLDTKPDPRNPQVVREIEAEELAAKAGYSPPPHRPLRPGGIFMFSLGGANGNDGPGGVALLDHDTFDVIGPWEQDRGDQYFGYDGWWHLNHDTVITSEWATPVDDRERPQPRGPARPQVRPPPQLLVDVGAHAHPAHRPGRRPPDGAGGAPGPRPEQGVGLRRGGHQRGGPVRVGVPLAPRRGPLGGPQGHHHPGRAGRPRPAAPALKPFGAVPPLISDIDLSVDDRWLYVSCWGTGELKQYDVSDIFHPRETGSVNLGGIVRRQPHPAAPARLPLAAGRRWWRSAATAKRAYVTNSLYGVWDDIFYPEGVGAWVAKLDADPDRGGLAPDPRFFPNGDDFRGLRVHQTRLQAATPPATPTATPADDMRPLAHHLGEDSLVNLLLVGGAGLSLMVVQGRARLAAARARLTRRVRGPEQRPHDGRR